MRDFLYSLPKNILRCFLGYNILWHFLAIALTYIIASSDFDWFYFVHTHNSALMIWFFPAIILGGLLPIILPLLLLAASWLGKNVKVKNIGFALAQAAIIGSFISSLYKAFTGRIHPDGFLTSSSMVDVSRQFQFGFWRGGIFWGWPSSHATIAFAMAVTLFMMFPKNKIMRVLVLAYAFYVAFGVSISIHWLSEAVAGIIFGSVIGVVVGKYYQKKVLF